MIGLEMNGLWESAVSQSLLLHQIRGLIFSLPSPIPSFRFFFVPLTSFLTGISLKACLIGLGGSETHRHADHTLGAESVSAVKRSTER